MSGTQTTKSKSVVAGVFAATPYALEDRRFLGELKAGGFVPRVVFDIGAASGPWSAVTSGIFPSARYELFEPLAGRFAEYDRRLAAVMAEHANFRVHGVALAESSREATLHVEESGLGSSLHGAGGGVNAAAVRVPVRRLDDYVREQGLEQPQVIKADVQAGELKLIEGGRATFAAADVVMLETHLVRAYEATDPLLPEVIAALEPMGLRLARLGGTWRTGAGAIASVDAFFVHDRLMARLGRERSRPHVLVDEALAGAAGRGRRRAALYGAGRHTEAVAPHFDAMPVPIVAVVEDNPKMRGGSIAGAPVIGRAELAANGVDCIVLSSDVYEEQMWQATADLRARGVEVLRLYEEGAGG